MALTIDEVTAEVETPPERREPEPARRPALPTPSELRRQREQIVRLHDRARRVCAD